MSPCDCDHRSLSFCAISKSTSSCITYSLVQRLVADPVHQPAARACVGRQLEVAAGLFAKELEAAAEPFTKKLEVAAGLFVKGVVAPARV